MSKILVFSFILFLFLFSVFIDLFLEEVKFGFESDLNLFIFLFCVADL